METYKAINTIILYYLEMPNKKDFGNNLQYFESLFLLEFLLLILQAKFVAKLLIHLNPI